MDALVLAGTGAVIGAVIGAGLTATLMRGYGGRRLAAGNAAPPTVSAPSGVEAYLDSMTRFSEDVTPAWSGHVESARVQMETAVESLTAKFAQIVVLLDEALMSSRMAGGTEQGHVFDHSRRRLAEVVQTLDASLAQKQQFLAGLQTLSNLNAEMKNMTSQVTRIAAQTHLLALNAAIEANRVGEVGAAFGVVAVEVRQLADLSGQIGSQIGQTADAVNDAISSAVSRATQNAEVEETMVLDANAKVHSVLDDLRGLVGDLQASSDRLGHTAEEIRGEIGQSLVQFQFQDRIGQTLSHVRESIDAFPPMLAEAQAAGPSGLRPLDHDRIQADLKASYTMVEEHHIHGSDPASGAGAQPESEITFF